MDWDTKYPADYLHAIRTNVPIELEALSYHSCPFVRARVAVRTNRAHVLEHLAKDREPKVVVNVFDNPLCSESLVRSVASSLRVHSGEKWHAVWGVLIRHPHTPECVRTLLKHKERERQAKIRRDVTLPPLPELAPPQAAPLARYTQRRIMLFMLRIEKNGRKNGTFTEAGLKYYASHPSKLVQKALKKYRRHMARLKKKPKSSRK